MAQLAQETRNYFYCRTVMFELIEKSVLGQIQDDLLEACLVEDRRYAYALLIQAVSRQLMQTFALPKAIELTMILKQMIKEEQVKANAVVEDVAKEEKINLAEEIEKHTSIISKFEEFAKLFKEVFESDKDTRKILEFGNPDDKDFISFEVVFREDYQIEYVILTAKKQKWIAYKKFCGVYPKSIVKDEVVSMIGFAELSTFNDLKPFNLVGMTLPGAVMVRRFQEFEILHSRLRMIFAANYGFNFDSTVPKKYKSLFDSIKANLDKFYRSNLTRDKVECKTFDLIYHRIVDQEIHDVMFFRICFKDSNKKFVLVVHKMRILSLSSKAHY